MTVTDGELPPEETEEAQPREREDRRNLLRRAVLRFAGDEQPVIVRNCSRSGARLRGDLPVTAGLPVTLVIPGCQVIEGEVRWVSGGEIGVRFATPIEVDANGLPTLVTLKAPTQDESYVPWRGYYVKPVKKLRPVRRPRRIFK